MSAAVVVGGGVAGLVAARRLAVAGHDVVVLEGSDAWGGRVRAHDVDGFALDAGAESFAVRGGAVAALLRDLGLADDLVGPMPDGAWVALADRTVPLPAGGVLGIPSSPLADDVRRVVDLGGSLRAYADRLLPVLKVGRYDRLGPLVRGRMGDRVLERLVTPVVESVYGVDPDEVAVDAIAPQLNNAITTTGSLSSAVLRMRTAAPAGSAAQGVVGGVFRLVEALVRDLAERGAELRTGVDVREVVPYPGGGWTVVTADGEVPADRVVVAVDGAAAFGLLRVAVPALAALPRPEPAVTRAVTVSVDEPALDARPRGSGVLASRTRTDVAASALTHVTGKWAWVADRLPAHRHVLRLAYRGDGVVTDERVGQDASSLLGVPLPGLRSRTDVVWRDTAPPLDERTRALRAALDPLPAGLAVTGSWVAGTGLAAVVAHAERQGG